MCFPLAAALPMLTMATTVASGVAGFAAQQQQYQAESARYEANYAAALQDNRTTETSLQQQEMETNQQYAEKSQLALVEGAQEQAKVTASAATAGVVGNSVQALVNGVGTQVNQKLATLNTQWQGQVLQSEGEKQTAVEQEVDRINEVAPPTSPNPLGAILGTLGSGLKYAGTSAGQSFFGEVTNAIGGGGTTLDTSTTSDAASGGGIGHM